MADGVRSQALLKHLKHPKVQPLQDHMRSNRSTSLFFPRTMHIIQRLETIRFGYVLFRTLLHHIALHYHLVSQYEQSNNQLIDQPNSSLILFLSGGYDTILPKVLGQQVRINGRPLCCLRCAPKVTLDLIWSVIKDCVQNVRKILSAYTIIVA